jgi:ComF family protein
LCLGCELNIPKWDLSANKADLEKKFAYQPRVSAAFAFMNYLKGGMAQKLIHALKYLGKKDLGIWLGEEFGKSLKTRVHGSVDLIVPVPLHRSRLKQRGYNQSDLIAKGLSNSLDIEFSDSTVERVKKTNTQTKKVKTDRWSSMDSVFSVSEPGRIDGQNIMIIDDVITTGATTGRLCDEIAKCNPKYITIAALAVGK